MLLRDICHIRKDHREGDGKDAGHGNDCKVPPEEGKSLSGQRSKTEMSEPFYTETAPFGAGIYSAFIN